LRSTRFVVVFRRQNKLSFPQMFFPSITNKLEKNNLGKHIFVSFLFTHP
jgi:hypothetical protein